MDSSLRAVVRLVVRRDSHFSVNTSKPTDSGSTMPNRLETRRCFTCELRRVIGEEIFPDPMSESMAESWRSGAAKALERQNAALLEAASVKA